MCFHQQAIDAFGKICCRVFCELCSFQVFVQIIHAFAKFNLNAAFSSLFESFPKSFFCRISVLFLPNFNFKIGHIAVLLLILIYRIDNCQCYCCLISPIAQMEASAPPWCFILFYISDCDVQFRYWYHSAHQTATVNSATDAVSLFPPLKAMPLEGCKCARSEAAHQTAMVNSATDAVSYFPQLKVMPPLKRCR